MVDAFLRSAGRTLEDVGGDPAALRERLEQAEAEARAAWPQLEVRGFAAVLGAHFGRTGIDGPTWFERLRAPDLWLATAAARGLRGAAEAFDGAHGRDLARAAQRFSGPRHPCEDLVQQILEKLVVGSAERRPKLAEYTGQGQLRSWLRVAAVRICLDAVRTGAQHKREEAVDDLVAVDLADDVELDFVKTTYRAEFKAAFAIAVGRLDTSERTLLKLSVLHGLGIDEIGALFHVHRATAARRVARARASLLEHTRAALREALAVRDEELDSIIGLAQSKLDVSLERLLQTRNRDSPATAVRSTRPGDQEEP